MGTWAAIGIHPPQVDDPQTAALKAMTLGNAMQERRMQGLQMQGAQLELQQKQQDFQDQQTIRNAYMQSGGDLDKTQELAMKAGASPRALMQLQEQKLGMKQKIATLDKDTLANDQSRHDALRGELDSFLKQDDQTKSTSWQPWIQQHVATGRLTPQEGQQLLTQFAAYPGDDQMKLYANGLATGSQLMKEESERRTADARKQTSDTGVAKLTDERDQRWLQQVAAAGSQQELDQLRAQAQQPGSGVSPAAIGKTPGMFSPAAMQKFGRGLVPTKDLPEFDIKAHQAELIQNAKPEDYLALVDQIAPPNVKENVPLNQRTKAQVQFALSRGDTQGAQDALKTASGEVRQLEVATDPRVQAGKVNVVVAEANAKNAANESAAGVTADDFTRAGEQYARTGVMPAIGRDAVSRNKIMHFGNEWARQQGMSPADVVTMQAAYQGDKKSLEKFQAQRDQIVSFEQTAQKNLDQFLSLASKIPDSGVPWLNTPIRLLDQKLIGAENMAAINAARQVANNEIAKVTSGGGLSGVLSDSARHEVEAYNPRDATLPQTIAVAKVLKQDMANRHQSMDQTLGDIKSRIGGGAQQPAGAPKAGYTFDMKTGQIVEKK